MSSLINEHGAFNRRKQGFVTKYVVKSLPDSRMKRKPHTAKGRKRMSKILSENWLNRPWVTGAC